MNIDEVYERLIKNIDKSRVKRDELMRDHTSFKVGGKAKILVFPQTAEDIIAAVKCCKESGQNYYIMGKGSNIIVKDSGYNGVIIKLGDHYNRITVNGDQVRADSGALLSMIASTAFDHSLEGIEFASGIPGTVGGAVTMNAGAYGGEMSLIVEQVRVISQVGEIITIGNKDMNFGYRHSVIQEKAYIVVGVDLKLRNGNKEEIKKKTKELTARRNEKQPVNFPSAGSIFKRPEGYFAGKLIEDAGLKGLALGGARVSPLHAGFIVNEGNAKAEDILSLIEIIKQTVLDKNGVQLETEVKVIGD